MFVPGLMQRRMAQAADRGEAALVVLRSVWASFTVALGLIGVVVIILWLSSDVGRRTGTSPGVALAVVLAACAGSLGIGEWLARRPLDCSSLPALAASYRQRFFLRVAVAEAAALVSFAAFVISGAAWLYPIGLVVAWWQLGRIAPTARHLAADQDRLQWRDCPLRLLDALALPSPPNATGGRGRETGPESP
jgi:hypothetical protein